MTRFTARFLVDMLRRRIEVAGGFAAILHSGDAQSGAILIVAAHGGSPEILYEKRPGWGDPPIWETIVIHAGTESDTVAAYVARRCRADADLWVVEVDVANSPQLIAEWGAMA
ncbi:MAG: hypothetical protein RLZZ58_900 [Pseudomonadota bacterium]